MTSIRTLIFVCKGYFKSRIDGGDNDTSSERFLPMTKKFSKLEDGNLDLSLL